MKNNEVQNIITACNKKINRWTTITLLISLLILFIQINLILKLFISVCFFLISVTIASSVIKTKYINPILNNELNPQKYYTVLCGTNNATKHAVDEVMVAYYMRDYNAVINICNLKLKDKRVRNYKYLFIQCLARTYFDLGDYDNLKSACEKFETELLKEKSLKSKEIIRKSFGNPIEYYKSYLNGDFKSCEEQYKRLLDDKITSKNKLSKISVYYLYAIACYKLNMFEKAKEYFTVILNEAPLLGFCETAKKYISAIDSNQEFIYDTQDIKVEENYEIPQGKAIKPDKKRAAVAIISLIALVVIICGASIINTPSTPEKVLKQKQGMTELIATTEINKEKDLLCFYNTKHDGYSAAFLDCKGENKYKVTISVENFWVGEICEIGIAKNDLIMEFAVYDSRSDIPADNYMIKEFLTDDGTTMYFCVSSVKNEKVGFSYTSTRLSEYYDYLS